MKLIKKNNINIGIRIENELGKNIEDFRLN